MAATTTPYHWRKGPTNNATQAYTQMLGLVNNIYSMRAELLRRQMDPRRDIREECGYPKPTELTPRKWKDLYDWEPYANRAVQVWCKESWQVQPSVYEVEATKVATSFEKYWDALGRRLRGDSCYYAEEKGSAVWEYLLRADIQCGVGQFAVILLGLDDTDDQGRGVPLEHPVRGIPIMRDCYGGDGGSDGYSYTQQVPKPPLPELTPTETAQDSPGSTISPPDEEAPTEEDKPLYNLLYLRVFPQTLVQISHYETNPFNPRYGQPVMYTIQTIDPQMVTGDGAVPTMPSLRVHWTRIVHIVDNIESNETHGKSRLEPILYPLLDIQKVRGSSAEMYYKGAFPGMALESIPQFGSDVVVDEEKLKDMMELYQNSLQRFISLFGMTAKQLAPQVVDPSPQIMVQVQAICVQLGIPMRIFMGSERGELASSQDDAAWNDRLKERQARHITPRIICLFVDRLIMLRVLPKPKHGYKVYWPDLTSQSSAEKAQVAATTVQTLATYVSGGVEAVIGLRDLFVRVLGWTEEEAMAVLKEVMPQATPDDGTIAPTPDTATPAEGDTRVLPETTPPNRIPQPSANVQNIEYNNRQMRRIAKQLEALATNLVDGMTRIASEMASAIKDKPTTNNFNIAAPEQKAQTTSITIEGDKPPVVNVTVPDSPTPIIHNEINVPTQDAPIVNVQIPEAPVPIVNVSSPETMDVRIIETVKIEKEEVTKVVRIEKNADGDYTGTIEEN